MVAYQRFGQRGASTHVSFVVIRIRWLSDASLHLNVVLAADIISVTLMCECIACILCILCTRHCLHGVL